MVLKRSLSWLIIQRYRGPDKLSVQLGIYPTRFLWIIAFFQKQLLKNIFTPLRFLKLLIYKYLIILVNNSNNNLSYRSKWLQVLCANNLASNWQMTCLYQMRLSTITTKENHELATTLSALPWDIFIFQSVYFFFCFFQNLIAFHYPFIYKTIAFSKI